MKEWPLLLALAMSSIGGACQERPTGKAASRGRASEVSSASAQPPAAPPESSVLKAAPPAAHDGEQRLSRMFAAAPVQKPYVGPLVASIVGSCAILVDGDVRCFDRLGFPPGSAGKPSSAGYYSDGNAGCFAAADGAVWCWGKLLSHVQDPQKFCTWQPWPPRREDVAQDEDEELHCPSTGGYYYCGFDQICEKPVKLARLNRVVRLVGRDKEYCALRSNGEVWCWGENLGYQGSGPRRCKAPAGVQNTTPYDVCRDPERVPGLPALASVSMLAEYRCGLSRDGHLYCWGSLPETYSRRIPADSASHFSDGALQVKWPVLKQAVIAADGACGIDLHGRVLCQPRRAEAPQPLAGFDDARQLAAGLGLICAANARHEVRCALRRDDGEGWLPPQVVPGLGDVAQLTVEDTRGCAVLEGGAAYCWGDRTYRGEFAAWPPLPALE